MQTSEDASLRAVDTSFIGEDKLDGLPQSNAHFFLTCCLQRPPLLYHLPGVDAMLQLRDGSTKQTLSAKLGAQRLPRRNTRTSRREPQAQMPLLPVLYRLVCFFM